MGGISGSDITEGKVRKAHLPSDVLYAAVAAATYTPTKVYTSTSGDQTTALQAFLTALSDGDEALIRGTINFTTVTIAHNNVNVRLAPGTVLNKTTALTDGVIITGNAVTFEGGTILCPATWDGTNVTPAYAVVRANGDSPTIRDLTLTNVPKVGIAVGIGTATGTAIITGCRVTGNYPAALWTEFETVNFGIMFDPGVTASRIKIVGNVVKSCVQGVFLGSYGASGPGSGCIVSSNDFEGCHNHAIYNAGFIGGVIVSGNTMVDCSRPIAMTGTGHVVTDNIMVTTGTGGNLNMACSIHMRNAIGCTVSNNMMKGDVYPTGAAIDFSPVSGGVVNRDNKVIGNFIEITGTNTAVGIRMGTPAITDHRNNIVQSNTIRGPGLANQGVISFFASTGAGFGNKCLDNDITVVGNSNGIHVVGQVGLDVRGNAIRFEYDSGTAIVLGGVYLNASSVNARIRDNDVVNPATFGTNVTVRAIWEDTGTTANRIGPNRYDLNLTKLTAGVFHIIQVTSSSILDEQLPGAPTTVCGPGSRWMRTDGGAGTTLYIKESAANSGTWRAV